METCDVKEALQAGAALVKPYDGEELSAPVFMVPSGFAVHSLKDYLNEPTRIRREIYIQDLQSFIRYVLQFKQDGTQVFMHQGSGGASLISILDYHTPHQPSWATHKATYEAQLSDEWNNWMGKNKKELTQVQLAEHLESFQEKIVEPPGAELLEMVTTLEGRKNLRYDSGVKLQNGRLQIRFEEDVELKGQSGSQKGSMELPQVITLGLAPFDRGDRYSVKARLRYRINNREIAFWYETIEPKIIIRDAIDSMAEQVQRLVGIAPLLGSA